jgi:hypothetical protein
VGEGAGGEQVDRRGVVVRAGRPDAAQGRRVGALQPDAALEQLREGLLDLAALEVSPSGSVTRSGSSSSPSSGSSARQARSRGSVGPRLLAMRSPVSASTTIQRRSPLQPPGPISTASSSSPSMALTG